MHKRINPHATVNECLVENSFGFVMRKGQGHNQAMDEYLQSKRRHAANFQMRLCDVPFNQDISVKLKDKGYQSINPAMKSKIPISKLKEIFDVDHMSDDVNVEEEKEPLSIEDQNLLQSAYLLSKSVPDRSRGVGMER